MTAGLIQLDCTDVAHYSNTQPVFAVSDFIKFNCQHCGALIELERAEFNEMGVEANRILGQVVECPQCNRDTVSYVLRNIDNTFAASTIAPIKKEGVNNFKRLIIITSSLMLIGLIALFVVLIYTSERLQTVTASIAGGIGGIVLLIICAIIAILIFILIVMWIIFPWIMYSQLKKIHSILSQIEHSTRK